MGSIDCVKHSTRLERKRRENDWLRREEKAKKEKERAQRGTAKPTNWSHPVK